MDDEDVAQVTPQHVLRQQAYILFYSKISSIKSSSIKPYSGAKTPVGTVVRTTSSIEVKNTVTVIPKPLPITAKLAVREESTMGHPIITQVKGAPKPSATKTIFLSNNSSDHHIMSSSSTLSVALIKIPITSEVKMKCDSEISELDTLQNGSIKILKRKREQKRSLLVRNSLIGLVGSKKEKDDIPDNDEADISHIADTVCKKRNILKDPNEIRFNFLRPIR